MKKINLFSQNKIRLFVLFLGLFIINGHFFIKYYDNVNVFLKHIPIPVLNCYSVPTTVFACPIGTIQHMFVIGTFSFITFGILLFIGALIGRWTCGWLCPFGFVQEALYHIPTKKIKFPSWLRYIKYVILVVAVIVLPIFWKNPIMGMSETYFCKICPAGSLGAGIPQVLMEKDLHALVGLMYWLKIAFLTLILALSVFVKRPFCSYLCPLGALLGICNTFSLLKIKFHRSKCVKCDVCTIKCPMGLDPTKEANSPECIRCMNCVNVCAVGALSKLYTLKN